MNDLRKINTWHGIMTTELNSNTSDDELNSMMNTTIGAIIDAFIQIPEEFHSITVEDLIDLIISDEEEEMEEIITGIFMKRFEKEPTDEDFEKLATALGKFAIAFGVKLEEDS